MSPIALAMSPPTFCNQRRCRLLPWRCRLRLLGIQGDVAYGIGDVASDLGEAFGHRRRCRLWLRRCRLCLWGGLWTLKAMSPMALAKSPLAAGSDIGHRPPLPPPPPCGVMLWGISKQQLTSSNCIQAHSPPLPPLWCSTGWLATSADALSHRVRHSNIRGDIA